MPYIAIYSCEGVIRNVFCRLGCFHAPMDQRPSVFRKPVSRLSDSLSIPIRKNHVFMIPVPKPLLWRLRHRSIQLLSNEKRLAVNSSSSTQRTPSLLDSSMLKRWKSSIFKLASTRVPTLRKDISIGRSSKCSYAATSNGAAGTVCTEGALY